MTTATPPSYPPSTGTSQRRPPGTSVRSTGSGTGGLQRNGHESNGSPSSSPEARARGLGWFSIGLGLAEVLSPGSVARLIGIDDTPGIRSTLFLFGMREIANGVGILSKPESSGLVWGRVAGDAMDLAFLSLAARSPHADRSRTGIAAAAVLGVAALDILTASELGQHSTNGHSAAAGKGGVDVQRAITVGRSAGEVYDFWRDFANLPRFMDHLESVKVLDERRSTWTAKAPAGTSVTWDAEIIEDTPGSVIAWRSLPGASVPNSGSVRFVEAPGGRGTEIHVHLRYDPPGGAVGAAIAKLFGEEPGEQVAGDLRRFKQVLEIGEVVHSDASVHQGMHPARPPAPTDKIKGERQKGVKS